MYTQVVLAPGLEGAAVLQPMSSLSKQERTHCHTLPVPWHCTQAILLETFFQFSGLGLFIVLKQNSCAL